MKFSLDCINNMSNEEIVQAFQELKASQTVLERRNKELLGIQKKINASRKRYFELFDLAPVGYVIVNVRGQIIETNQQACRMLGVPGNRLIKQSLSRFIHDKDLNIYQYHRRQLFKNRLLRAAQSCELRVVKPDGLRFWASLEGVAIQDPEGFIVCRVVIIDIDRQKHDEEKIKLMNARLQKTVAERDKFFTIISHDLRSPFIGFLAFIRILTERIETLSLKEIQRLANTMRHNAENLYNLLENLLEWSIIQRGSMSYSPVPCCLESNIRANIDLMQPVALQKNIRFECFVPDDLHVFADKFMLSMILRNLLSNAVKFSRDNGKVRISAETAESFVEISVSDDGTGMQQEVLENLFTLDRITSIKGTAGEKGTGLGLLLCREYVEKHNGEIRVQSSPGKGAVFSFTLPVQKRPFAEDK